MARLTSGTAMGAILNQAFPGTKRIRTGRPKVIVANAAPVNSTDAAPIGTFWHDADNDNTYINTANVGTWVKINA